ncbi:unnamed protein product, partial [Iphiclides podalirius]
MDLSWPAPHLGRVVSASRNLLSHTSPEYVQHAYTSVHESDNGASTLKAKNNDQDNSGPKIFCEADKYRNAIPPDSISVSR